jgi:hypothetical protein
MRVVREKKRWRQVAGRLEGLYQSAGGRQTCIDGCRYSEDNRKSDGEMEEVNKTRVKNVSRLSDGSYELFGFCSPAVEPPNLELALSSSELPARRYRSLSQPADPHTCSHQGLALRSLTQITVSIVYLAYITPLVTRSRSLRWYVCTYLRRGYLRVVQTDNMACLKWPLKNSNRHHTCLSCHSGPTA